MKLQSKSISSLFLALAVLSAATAYSRGRFSSDDGDDDDDGPIAIEPTPIGSGYFPGMGDSPFRPGGSRGPIGGRPGTVRPGTGTVRPGTGTVNPCGVGCTGAPRPGSIRPGSRPIGG